ncbi:urea transporter 1-like isoform X2 [Odontomachus brunneus]|uniref:urea transporter 1-like isoform X2 n=1 Tax=Odontomachus brunneus TaxID=486640 RepID=UPI0013F19C48|nr:urea transporter 1-like isoform X2 [Odontomachus brunneus]XP_032667189.1 urea transporter 1-like isoform X2 [Odontomachus brunneus]
MAARELPVTELRQTRKWVPCVGDFAILKKYYAEKKRPFWLVLQLFDALLRGFGQVVFANNPLSGLLIAVTLAAVAPGALALSAATGVLGLLLSVLVRDSQDNVENGLTVYNPLLVGVVSYALVPQIYGAFDAFSFLHLLLGTIFSVYLARSLGSDKFPCTTWPFNLVEFALIFALSTRNGTAVVTDSVEPMFEMHNATSETMTTTTTTTVDGAGFYVQNATTNVDWGMLVRGIIVAPSQVFAIDNTMFGSVVYLAILLFSPTMAAFSFLGALVGCFAGLELGAEYGEIYNGYWGYNSLLTGAALGGNLLVLNSQTTVATVVAIVYTTLVQYSIQFVFTKVGLPILTLPFVIVVSLFLKLRSDEDDATFPQPMLVSFPEKQRHEYLASRTALVQAVDIPGEFDLANQN